MPLVLSQPDRPAGRGMKLQASPVKQCALEHGIAVAQPRSLRLDGKYPEDAAAAQAAIAAAPGRRDGGRRLRVDPAAMGAGRHGAARPPEGAKAPWGQRTTRSGAWGPRPGCLNIHASLLPRWRGAAPIHRAIEAGDAETGVTIMQMDAGLDTGDMLLCEATAIAPADTQALLHDRLADMGGRLIVQALRQAANGGLVAHAAAGRRHHLRAQDRQGREPDRLEPERRGDRPARARLRPFRAPAPSSGLKSSRCGTVKLIAVSARQTCVTARFCI